VLFLAGWFPPNLWLTAPARRWELSGAVLDERDAAAEQWTPLVTSYVAVSNVNNFQVSSTMCSALARAQFFASAARPTSPDFQRRVLHVFAAGIR